jgi:hypothetical protein
MVPDLFFYQLMLIALVWLCLMLQWAWPSAPAAVCPTHRNPHPHGPSAPVSPTPLRASPPSRTATPVNTRVPPAHTPLQPHHRASS